MHSTRAHSALNSQGKKCRLGVWGNCGGHRMASLLAPCGPPRCAAGVSPAGRRGTHRAPAPPPWAQGTPPRGRWRVCAACQAAGNPGPEQAACACGFALKRGPPLPPPRGPGGGSRAAEGERCGQGFKETKGGRIPLPPLFFLGRWGVGGSGVIPSPPGALLIPVKSWV